MVNELRGETAGVNEIKELRIDLDYLASTYGLGYLIVAEVVVEDGRMYLDMEGSKNRVP